MSTGGLSAARCVFQTSVFLGKLAVHSSNVFTFTALRCRKVHAKCFRTNYATVTTTTPSMWFIPKRHLRVTSALKTSRNHYDVLGVSRNADQKQIKDAYYKLAMTYHPDKNQGKLTQKFREIKEAYDVLSNEASRMQYNNSLNNKYTSTSGNRTSNSSYSRYNSPPYEKYRQTTSRTEYQRSNKGYTYDYSHHRPYNVFINIIKVPKKVVQIQLDIILMTFIKNRLLKVMLLYVFQLIWSQVVNSLNFNVLLSSTTQTNSLIEFIKDFLTNNTVRIELTEMEAIRGKAIRVQVDENEKVLVVNIPGGAKKGQSFYLFYLVNDDGNSTSSFKS